MTYCKSKKCLVGKTTIVTGANTGIGFETALDFAKRGGRVILACRNEEKAKAARDKIINATGNANIIVKQLNLESLKSVRQFANDINTSEDRLDILVNNAGLGDMPHRITEDGLQVLMEVNYFSPFLLTNLLLDLLKKSAPSRIVNVSSSAAKLAKDLKVDKLNEPDSTIPLYSRTKLCNIYFTIELAKRLEGTNVTTYSLHPGIVQTEFQRFSVFWRLVAKGFLTPEEGAQTSIYTAIEEDIEQYSGQHFEDCKPVKPYCNARDQELAKNLWEASEKLVGLKED